MAAPTDVFRPDARGRPRPAPRSRFQSRWAHRLFVGLIVFVSLCVLATGGAYVYLRIQLDKIKRVDLPGLADDAAGAPMNVLLVGSDSRERVTGDLADATGRSEEGDRTGLSDTMMVLHIDPNTQQAAILSIPRDLYVPIAGTTYSDRINTAFAVGGAATLIETIQQSLGITINHYVEVDFQGFAQLVDTLGGLRVYFTAPARDEFSGLDIPDAGCVQLDGYQALAYVRSRHYESYEAGRWIEDPSSDFGRIKRQQDFIRRMMKKAVSQGLTNPLQLNRLVTIGVNNVTLDSAMSTRDIVTVARRFRSLDPDSVDMQTLPTEGDLIGGAAVQILLEEEAQPLIDKINGKAPPDPSAIRPSEVRVRVLNGNGADGAASKAGFALQNAGFAVVGTGDADTFTYTQTVIRHAPGKDAEAELLRSYLAAGATLQSDSALGTADVAVVVGADYTGVRAGPGAPPPTAPGTTSAPADPAPDARGSSDPAC